MNFNNILASTKSGESFSNVTQELDRAGINLKEIQNIPNAHEALMTRNYSLFLIRSEIVDEKIFSLIQFRNRRKLPIGIIVSVRKGFLEDAVRCIKAVADDFIVSEHSDARLIEGLIETVMEYQKKKIEIQATN